MIMAITFRCEHCGMKVEAPDSAGGKRGKCPYCKQSNYIPSPVSDQDVLELAGEDEQEEKRRREEEQARRAHERDLVAEMDRDDSAPIPLDHRPDLKAEDVHHLVVNYCLDLANRQLPRAETHLKEMRKVKRTATEAVNDFLTGKVSEPALKSIPPKLLEAFLHKLQDLLK
jgi:phage FluMu protein Com